MGTYNVGVRVIVLVIVGVLEAGMVLDGVGEISGNGVLLNPFVGGGVGVLVASSFSSV